MGILIKAPTRRNDAGLQIAMPAAGGEMRSSLHIREVVRITGLRGEQLYMWQRRYGFPNPARDPFGDRVYPPDQVVRLKVIKQLLSEGWRAAQTHAWQAPGYWEKCDGRWWLMTLSGMRPVHEAEPVCHVSYFEAEAFARWAGARLPTEAEWEVTAQDVARGGNFVESGRDLHGEIRY